MFGHFAKRFAGGVGAFLLDLLDKGAKPVDSSNLIPELWAVAGVIGASALSYTESVEKLLVSLLGSASGLVPASLGVAGLIWSVWVIVAKHLQSSSKVVTDVAASEYLYRQPVRQIAKVGFFLLLVLVPLKGISAVEDLVPLPRVFYGFLLDSKTGQPIQGVLVRVVSADGIDLTQDGTWESDSYGFYVVRSSKAVRRDGHLSLSVMGCSATLTVPIRRIDQCSHCPKSPLVSPNINPVFRHFVSCGNGQ